MPCTSTIGSRSLPSRAQRMTPPSVSNSSDKVQVTVGPLADGVIYALLAKQVPNLVANDAAGHGLAGHRGQSMIAARTSLPR